MRNAAGDEMTVPLKPTIAFDDPEAMCQAAVLGTRIALMKTRPGRILRILPVDIPRPRQIEDAAVSRLAGRIKEMLAVETERALREELRDDGRD